MVPPIRASAEIATTDTTMPSSSPLLITAYRAHLVTATTDTKGKVLTQRLDDVVALELYNNGDQLLDLKQWHIFDAADPTRELQFTSSYTGYLVPGDHVVLAKADIISDATYTLTGWTHTTTKDAAVPALQLVAPGYRMSQTDIKVSDIVEKRNFGVSSYTTTFSDAVIAGTPNVDTLMTDVLFDDGLYNPPELPMGIEISEVYPYASDCDPLATSVLCGDYVELHNAGDAAVDLSNVVLRTDSNSSSRTTSNTFSLDGILLPDEYMLVARTDDAGRISLTNSGGYIWLEDAWNIAVYAQYMTEWPSASSDKQGFAYMRSSDGTWQWTTTPTPGVANIATVPAPIVTICPEGKYLNPDTGRCRSIEEAVSALAACEEGYERNPTTNRCRKIVTATTTGASLTPCAEGQERNPATNRCRSIASAVAELIPCDEGYERNPSTNRCRKIQSASIPAAPFAVQASSSPIPVWQWAVGGAVGAALVGYAVWEWRREIAGLWQRMFKK